MSHTKKPLEIDEDPVLLEYEYEPIHKFLALETKKKSLHLEQITMEEMIVAQHNDTFCTDIARRLN